MSRPHLVNRRSALLGNVIFDGYDFGLQLQFVEGANRLLLERDGFYMRRSEHPLYRYWRLPKGKLLAELDLLFHSLMALVDGRYAESWQSFCKSWRPPRPRPIGKRSHGA